VANRLGYITEEFAVEIEKEINGVGAPLAGLVRSTRAALAISLACFVLVFAIVAWFAA
jgi:hypothetical protein